MPGTPARRSLPDQAGILSQFAATDLDGNEIDQSILEGYDLTMVNIWATFCQPCIREMPVWASWPTSTPKRASNLSAWSAMFSTPTGR